MEQYILRENMSRALKKQVSLKNLERNYIKRDSLKSDEKRKLLCTGCQGKAQRSEPSERFPKGKYMIFISIRELARSSIPHDLFQHSLHDKDYTGARYWIGP